MYLPESKYSKPKYTSGEELTLPNGQFYVGWYFTAYTGQIFTGKGPSKASKLLTPLPSLGTEIDEGAKFVSEIVKPTELDYQDGFFTRYFLQDKRNKSIIEVTKQKYLSMNRLRYLKGAETQWQLTGPAEDTKFGPYIHFGAASKNKEAVEELEKTISGIKNFIKSFSEFVK